MEEQWYGAELLLLSVGVAVAVGLVVLLVQLLFGGWCYPAGQQPVESGELFVSKMMRFALNMMTLH